MRLGDGTVVAVFAPVADRLQAGQQVGLRGRFYKRLSAVARDGQARVYPAVVARRVSGSSWRPGSLLIIIVLVGLGGTWMLVRRAAASSGTVRRRQPDAVRSRGELGNPMELPKEPAEALDVLRSRHDHPEEEVPREHH